MEFVIKVHLSKGLVLVCKFSLVGVVDFAMFTEEFMFVVIEMFTSFYGIWYFYVFPVII